MSMALGIASPRNRPPFRGASLRSLSSSSQQRALQFQAASTGRNILSSCLVMNDIHPTKSLQSLFHPLSQILPSPAPAPPTHSTIPLEYSIGTPPPRCGMLQTPVFIIAFLNNRPPSPAPTRSSSHASRMLFHCRSSSSWREALSLFWKRFHARWMVQWRNARVREKRRGRGVRVVGWWR